MKRKYENFYICFLLVLIVFIIEIIFVIVLCNIKFYKYKVIDAIALKEDLFEVVVSKDSNIIESNSTLYINNKKYKFSKVLVTEDIINNYNSYVIKIKNKEKIKERDIIKLSIFDNSESVIGIFKLIWKGD